MSGIVQSRSSSSNPPGTSNSFSFGQFGQFGHFGKLTKLTKLSKMTKLSKSKI